MISAKTKALVIQRANSCCEYCQSQLRHSPAPFSVEHIIPLSAGGDDAIDNLALACQGCNNHKYNSTQAKDPISGTNAPLFHPRKDRWTDHFIWTDDFTRILGTTPTGRATIERLQLNRKSLVSLREALVIVNQHPPDFAGA